jgi:hypothetical protein
MCLIYTDFQVFISFTQPLAGFYGKKSGENSCLSFAESPSHQAGSVAK